VNARSPRANFARRYFVPQLLVGVPRSAQHVSSLVAQVPWLHHDVTALRPATAQAQHVGWQSSGFAQAEPAAPFFHGNVCCAPAHEKPAALALAIEPACVTVIGPVAHTDDAARSAGAAPSPSGSSSGAERQPPASATSTSSVRMRR